MSESLCELRLKAGPHSPARPTIRSMQSGIEIDCKWRKRRGRRRSWRRGSGVKLANPTDKIEKNKFYPAFFSPVRWSFGLNPSLPFCNLSAAVGGLYASVTEL